MLLAASLAVFTLYGQLSSSAGQTSAIGKDVQRAIASSFTIVQVYDGNIYIRGVSGELNVDNVLVTLNGSPVPVTVNLLRDEGSNGLLDPNDLAVIFVGEDIRPTDCLMVDIDGVTNVWGVCS